MIERIEIIKMLIDIYGITLTTIFLAELYSCDTCPYKNKCVEIISRKEDFRKNSYFETCQCLIQSYVEEELANERG